ncbi:hypothetical protein H4W33_006411 [Kibdelosporangium phytohabitans]|nr:hypothetical protein [Kibdelosporangium phytohabitans]
MQRGLQLFRHDLLVVHRALLQDADGGHVGQGLSQRDAVVVDGGCVGVEQGQSADHLVAQPHRHRTRGPEPRLDRGGHEPRPAGSVRDQISTGNRHAGLHAVDTRALLGLRRENLDQFGVLGGTRRRTPATALIGQDHSRGVDLEQLNGPFGQQTEEVQHIEVGDQGVGQRHERARQSLVPDIAHHDDLPSPSIIARPCRG